jgi:N-methylhydantoinase B
VQFKRQALRCDAAGPGEYRGGTGCDYEVEMQVAADYAFRGEGIDTVSSFGMAGGSPGAVGSMTLQTNGHRVKAPKYGVQHHPPLTLRATSPGGAGWGEPRRRPPAKVLRDVRDGVVSAEAAETVYAVALTPDGKAVDEARTAALRAR